ncbi:hypothetical protein R6Q59_033655 [Mikania micrantha]
MGLGWDWTTTWNSMNCNILILVSNGLPCRFYEAMCIEYFTKLASTSIHLQSWDVMMFGLAICFAWVYIWAFEQKCQRREMYYDPCTTDDVIGSIVHPCLLSLARILSHMYCLLNYAMLYICIGLNIIGIHSFLYSWV